MVLRGDDAGKLSRILQVEIARRSQGSAIENRVDVQSGELSIAPGTSRGWTSASYPFGPEAVAGVGPLLLPWRDRPQRYRFESSALVAHSQ